MIDSVPQGDKGGAMKTSSEKFQEAIDWYGKMLDCIAALPPNERAAFDEWDQKRTGETTTSDWPGFDRYLPTRPSPIKQP
jgi:hypothetical protein